MYASRGGGAGRAWSRPLQYCKVFRPVLYACMHLYASGDAYRKSPEKARKPL
ncbi:hypothetical protein I118_1106 [Bifidobacterium longum D2957]|nr:hypothetical protein I118_1106 [Bifidobacterium longum D2957]